MQTNGREIVRFLAAGGLAAAVNWASRFAFSRVLPYEASIVLAYLVGMAIAFVLMRSWVFRAEGDGVAFQLAKYALVNVASVLQTLVVSSVLARWVLPSFFEVDRAQAVAHAVGVAVPAVSSYIGHKWLTFRK